MQKTSWCIVVALSANTYYHQFIATISGVGLQWIQLDQRKIWFNLVSKREYLKIFWSKMHLITFIRMSIKDWYLILIVVRNGLIWDNFENTNRFLGQKSKNDFVRFLVQMKLTKKKYWNLLTKRPPDFIT